MNPRALTVAEIADRLTRYRRLPKRTLAALARDRRAAVRRLAARYRAHRAAVRAEALRLRALYREERRRARRGLMVAGVDEVGVGPLAGPVVAAAVILGPGRPIRGLDDSKRLRPKERERLDREIRARARGVALGEASVEEIDRLNIYRAARLAMLRAVAALAPQPHFLLVDGREGLPERRPQAAVIKGDAACACIAAASIVAKVARDRRMAELDQMFPFYGFARHKGYGTAVHLAALARYGPCPAHRRAFLPGDQLPLFPLP
jgi:ribonuclease HII